CCRTRSSGRLGGAVAAGSWLAVRLQCADLGEPAAVPLGARKLGFQEDCDQIRGQRGPDHTSAEAEHVAVVVLDPLARGEAIMAKPGPDSGELVGGNRRAHAAAANQNAALGAAFAHGAT